MGGFGPMGRLLRGDKPVNFGSTHKAEAAFLAGLLCLGATAGFAQQIKKGFPTGPKPSLLLRNQNGGISVKTWDQNQIEIQAEPSSDAMEVTIIPGEQKVTVQTHPKGDRILPP